MDGIINNPFSGQKYIQYGKHTFENITDQVRITDHGTAGVDLTKGHILELKDTAAPWKKYYSDIALSQSPVANVKKEVDAKTSTAINGFFDGTVSEDELADTFQTLAGQLSDACESAGYPGDRRPARQPGGKAVFHRRDERPAELEIL